MKEEKFLVRLRYGTQVFEIEFKRKWGKHIYIQRIEPGKGSVLDRVYFEWITKEQFDKDYVILEC